MVTRRLLTRAVDLVLVGAAAFVLFGPGGPLRLEIETWAAERRLRLRARALWPALVDGGASLGRGGAGDPVLVEFTDYRCPWCTRAQAAVDSLLADGVPVRVVVRHFPVAALHPDAPLLARVAVCAEQDPAFAAIHRALFDAPPDALGRRLAAAGARDPPALLRCADSAEAGRRVAADLRLAARLGIAGTPTFLTRDRARTGALSREALLEMLGLDRRPRPPHAPVP